jgi:hypothetical protein
MIQSFVEEIMDFLTEEDVKELEEKAGVKFPLDGLQSDLCYVCCWMGLKRELPRNIHNRMIIGEANEWSRLYIRVLEGRRRAVIPPKDMEELFDLAG